MKNTKRKNSVSNPFSRFFFRFYSLPAVALLNKEREFLGSFLVTNAKFLAILENIIFFSACMRCNIALSWAVNCKQNLPIYLLVDWWWWLCALCWLPKTCPILDVVVVFCGCCLLEFFYFLFLLYIDRSYFVIRV